jgi:hypothetical protein
MTMPCQQKFTASLSHIAHYTVGNFAIQTSGSSCYDFWTQKHQTANLQRKGNNIINAVQGEVIHLVRPHRPFSGGMACLARSL